MEEKKKTIWDISDEMMQIIYELEENGGELTEELEAKMAETEESIAGKADGYYSAMKYLETDINALGDEIKSLQAIKKSKENSLKNIKNTLTFFMQKFGMKDLQGKFHKFTLSKSKSIFTDDEAISNDYLGLVAEITDQLPPYISVELKISKTAIKEYLKETGEMPKGSEMRENTGLRVR